MDKINWENNVTPLNKATMVQFESNIEKAINNVFETIYPIGHVMIVENDIDYTDYLGFVWSKTNKGRVLVGLDEEQEEFNQLGKTGGSKELQKHTHDVRYQNIYNFTGNLTFQDIGEFNRRNTYFDISNTSESSELVASESGLGEGKNLQPYKVVNYWTRIV